MTIRRPAPFLLWSLAAAMLIPAAAARATTLLVPAYFSPGTDWTALTAAAAGGASITAIVNPDSGPGTAVDPAYTAALASFESAGGTVVGYVSTDYGKRSLAAVEADVSTYKAFYPVDGIFFDQMTSDAKASNLTYYADLFDSTKSMDSAYDVIGNPGTAVPQSYAAVADTLVTYEGTGASYAANAPASWTTAASTPAAVSANVAYEVPTAAAMLADLARARSQNVGAVYFTNDGADGNPYDSLPSYFDAEVAAIETSASPEPSSGPLLTVAAGSTWALVRRRRRPLACEGG